MNISESITFYIFSINIFGRPLVVKVFKNNINYDGKIDYREVLAKIELYFNELNIKYSIFSDLVL